MPFVHLFKPNMEGSLQFHPGPPIFVGMGLLALVIVGIAAGFLATRLMNIEADLITTVSIGVLGALVGGLVLRASLMVMGWAAGFVGAVLGAMALIWLWQRYWPR